MERRHYANRTYNMNDLQKLPVERHGPVLVTLNPPFEVDAAKTVGRYQYEHPMYSAAVRRRIPFLRAFYAQLILSSTFDLQSVRAQSRLPEIQNARRVTFAGAWTNYGFHEDGFTSGLKLAVDQFGAEIPFPIRPADRAIKKELVARAIVAGIEQARVLMASTPLAMTLNWLILYLLTAIVRLVSLTGRRDWVSEAESVCAFWRPQQAKGQRKKMQ
jgi:predicted NAD/FAD-binding protein